MKYITCNFIMCTILLFMSIRFVCQNMSETFNFNSVSETIQTKVIKSQKNIKKLKSMYM